MLRHQRTYQSNCFRACPGWLPRTVALTMLGVIAATSLHAANTVNPDNDGSTDVIRDPDSTNTQLGNPLADSLNLGSDLLSVGQVSVGELRINLGSDVSNGSSHIGNNVGSTGTVTVTGVGSTWTNSNNLFVGNSGTGTLNINDGSLVSVGNTTTINSVSILSLSGGQLTTGSFDNSAGGTFNHTGGNLSVDGGMFDPGVSGYSINNDTNASVLQLLNNATASLSGNLTVASSGNGVLQLSGGSIVSTRSALLALPAARQAP